MRRRPFAIALVGASVLVREGLARILRAADFRVVASASSVADLVLSPSSQKTPTALIIHTGDQPGAAVQQIRAFKEHQSAGPVVVVGDRIEAREIVLAFGAGANAYFCNVCSCDAFIKSLELVMLGETVIIPRAILPLIFHHENHHEDDSKADLITNGVERNAEALSEVGSSQTPHLSPRQQTILRCLISGDSNKAIARKTDIAEATVKVHVKTILRKIRVHNRTQAAIWATNNSLFASAFYSGPSCAKPADQRPSIPPAPQEPFAATRNASASLRSAGRLAGENGV